MVRRVWPAVAGGLIVLALFGRLPVVPMYVALVVGVLVAWLDIVALVRAWRAGNEGVDYTGWVEPDGDDDDEQRSEVAAATEESLRYQELLPPASL